jgi:hypothetical protein
MINNVQDLFHIEKLTKVLDDNEYYNNLFNIWNSNNTEYSMLLCDTLGRDRILFEKLFKFENLCDKCIVDKLNKEYTTLEDKVIIKWKFNELYMCNIKIALDDILNIYDDRLVFIYESFGYRHRQCMPDTEYELFKKCLVKGIKHAKSTLCNIMFYAEGKLLRNRFNVNIFLNRLARDYVCIDGPIIDRDKCLRRVNEINKLCKYISDIEL